MTKPMPTETQRRQLRKAALQALEERMAAAAIPPKGKLRRGDHALLNDLTVAQIRHAFDGVASGAGGELKPSRKGLLPFCSAESSCALGVNTFAVFIGQAYRDSLLDIHIRDPDFEPTFRVKGVRSRVPPTPDVLIPGKDRACVLEAKVLEPWRSPPETALSNQYDKPAESVSPNTLEVLRQIRSGEIGYFAFDAAQMLKHFLGIHSAIKKGDLPSKTTLVAYYWEPCETGSHGPLFELLAEEAADFAGRLGDQPVKIQAVSTKQLWAGWRRPGSPGWLQTHAAELERRYSVKL